MGNRFGPDQNSKEVGSKIQLRARNRTFDLATAFAEADLALCAPIRASRTLQALRALYTTGAELQRAGMSAKGVRDASGHSPLAYIRDTWLALVCTSNVCIGDQPYTKGREVHEAHFNVAPSD